MTVRVTAAAPPQVWDVLADGWLYPVWVVGAARVRGVDETWPAVGAKIHHSVGAWPLMLSDHTEVLESRPGEFLLLLARGWPVGEAHVSITLTALAGNTQIEIVEDVVSGVGLLVPRPIRRRLIDVRNVETLRRLAYVAEGRR